MPAVSDFWLQPIGRDVEFGLLNRHTTNAPRQQHPQLIANEPGNTMLRALRTQLRSPFNRAFTFSVAFITPKALSLLRTEFLEFAGRGTIITSDYLGFNSPGMFRSLLQLHRDTNIGVRFVDADGFHPKGYVFERADGITAILGSSNLTDHALQNNAEWNLQVSATLDSDLYVQFKNLLEVQLTQSVPLTEAWVQDYETMYVPPPPTPLRGRRLPHSPSSDNAAELTPNDMQRDALARIAAVRSAGHRRALVISATGTGKTILAALDVQQAAPKRVLFLAHREQILDRAMSEFARVMPDRRVGFGKFGGGHRTQADFITFAMVQTLSQPENLQQFAPDSFDYVLIDEVHRATAPSYRAILDHFTPEFTLGLTATPDRADGDDVYALFDHTIAYEIRLNDALGNNMLTPFHYFGVADYTFTDGETVSDNLQDLARLASTERLDHLLSAIGKYGDPSVTPRGLIFCSRKEEAVRLAAALNGKRLYGEPVRAVALTGDDSIATRTAAVQRLEEGALNYIVTVDIFNEGIDIPSINQIVMLRQTQSPVVFTQQLGRGLRKHPDKTFVTVIDFIGNYANNYMIPIALFGDRSHNKDTLRQLLISAEEDGVFSGLSAIRFDRISQQRVLAAISNAPLNKIRVLKTEIEAVRSKLGRYPTLVDLHQHGSIDPHVAAKTLGNYQSLLHRIDSSQPAPSPAQARWLSFLSSEVLGAKRTDELLATHWLLAHGYISDSSLRDVLIESGLSRSERGRAAIRSSLDGSFLVEVERQRFAPIAASGPGNALSLDAAFLNEYRTNDWFHAAVDDLLAVADLTVRPIPFEDAPFTIGERYSRRDACRLLNWGRNTSSTVYGYRVHRETMTTPIFVTYHKTEDVGDTIAYGDEIIDARTFLWYSRSRLTTASSELQPILDNTSTLHLFVKHSDAEGTDFLYFGRATSSDAKDATMPDGSTPVVHMHLNLKEPIPTAVLDYFAGKLH